MPARTSTAIVLGAGVVGVTTAYALAQRGIQVTLVDRHGEPAMGTSHANGAQLSYLYTDALASPRIWRQLPALLLGQDSAFRFRVRPDPDYAFWLLAFLRNCTSGRFERNTLATFDLAMESRLRMDELLARHDLEFDHVENGKMHLYPDAGLRPLVQEIRRLKPADADEQVILSHEEACEIEPALVTANPKPAFVLYSPKEAVGDPYHFARELLGVLKAQYGVTVRFGEDAIALEEKGGEAVLTLEGGETLTADQLVVCTGLPPRFLRRLGLKLPVCPMKGYSFTAPAGPAAPDVSLTDTQRRTVITRLGDAVRVAGLADLGWRETGIDQTRLESLIRAARDGLPQAADYEATYNHWTGLRPMTPDTQPRIGRLSPAIAYNLGHGMLGWTLAMGSSERLARLITGNAGPVSLTKDIANAS